ncbi:hypothetical protein NDU88_008617 [Pleurodeles waltl]|uniref:Reverse transcriptase domain-containing protein n=1 Tax=Pleurodeles waltl TaxID=8319 RepID=A0AAV7NZU9_PLEWA|nr:hypothetical protein NDU88_008617 [Pleurodeles waltl]
MKVLTEAENVFNKKLGCLKGYVHKVNVKCDASPVQHKSRWVPLSVREGLKKHLAEMLEDGAIEPVEASERVSPVVNNKKADGRLRFCVDLRSVNQNIVVDVFPLPNISELLTLVKDKRNFSKLDLRSAYHQVGEKRTSSCVKVGDWAKVKSGRIQGGLTKFKGPVRVRQVGTHFVILENGAMFMSGGEVVSGKGRMFVGDCIDEVANEFSDDPVEGEEVPALQKRIRKPPSYLEDFVR